MKRTSIGAVLAVLGTSLAFATAAHAVTITIGGAPTASSGEHSTVAGVTHVNFDDPLPSGWAITGDMAIVEGSVEGHYAAPPNYGENANTSWYLTVPSKQSSGTATISLDGSYNYYGLYWGSIDAYNTLSFLDGDIEVFSITGSQAAALVPTQADGNQSLAAYFNFFDLPQFDTVRLSSTSYAFESDNHAFGNVPVPATAWLFALGLLGLAARRCGRAA